jgi:lactoylglutathione lyase
MTVRGFWHGGVSVSDMDRSLGFYVDRLGLEKVSDRVVTLASVLAVTRAEVPGIRVCMLKVPGEATYLELLQYGDAAPATPRDDRASAPGTGHLCFYVDDLRATWEQLRIAGVRSLSDGPVDCGERIEGSWCVYLRDPDGFLIELFEGPRYPSRTPIGAR